MKQDKLLPTSPPRVRFAPSPTGHLHVGGARTALFNWLFARNSGGTFILRIEDSDQKRSEAKMVEEILEEVRWLGLDWDEGPFFQSRRLEIYRQYASLLLREGKAYESAAPARASKALIFRVGEEEIEFFDLVRGAIRFSTQEIKDIVLLKSDGTPTYNFACAVDDHEMGISHVIRGEDHISNTPKQILLYRALGWDPPHFGHLPLILGADKSPLSKRHGAVSLKSFREEGYLPEALRNYLALLGWSPGDDRELFPTSELIREFSLARVNRSAAVFDYQKFLWLNGRHMQRLSPEECSLLVAPFLEKAGWGDVPRARVEAVIGILGARLKTLEDVVRQGEYFFRPEVYYQPEAVKKHLEKEGVSGLLKREQEILAAVTPFTAPLIEKALRELIAGLDLKVGDAIHPLRVAVTGRAESPSIFEVMELVGKTNVLERLGKTIANLTAGKERVE